MSAKEILEAQENIVCSMAELAPPKWSMIVMNMEITEGSSGSPVTDRVCFWIRDSETGCKSENISIPIELQDKFISLREKIKDLDGSYWDICDLTIFSSGRYEFQLGYDGVKRLNSIFDFDSMFRFDSHKDEYMRRKNAFESE